MKRLFGLLLFFTVTTSAWGQSAPTISSISVKSTYPLDTIIISGAGFSATPANLQVWFGTVMGSIISSSDFLIKVVVPPQAKYTNIEVINLTTRLSVKSTDKFHSYFSGNSFNAGLMTLSSTFQNNDQLYDLCSCDFDLDGKPDIAATKFAVSQIAIYRNTSVVGTTSFAETNASVGSFFTQEVTCGDLNGDGKPEIVASRSDGGFGGNRNAIFVLPNTSTSGSITFGTAIPLLLANGEHARYVSIRDLNLDGKPEIVVSNSFSNNLYIFKNQSSGGALNINATPIQLPVQGATNLYGLEIQDMDGDTKPEIIVTQFLTSNMFILRNQSSTTDIAFAAPAQLNFTGAFNKLVSADFNEDGKWDFANSNWNNNRVAIWINTSTGSTFTFAPSIGLDSDLQPDGIDVGDIDGDQDIDIVCTSRASNNINVFLNSGNNVTPAFSAKMDVVHTKNTRNILLADLDGDAKPEITVTSRTVTSSFSLDIFRNKNCFVPVLLTQSPVTMCPGQTVPLHAIPAVGVTFDWKQNASTIQSSTNPNVLVSAFDSYTVTAISEAGACNNTTTSILVQAGTGTIPPDPVISTNGPICSGQTMQLSAPAVAGATYNWTGPNNFTASTTSATTTITSAVAAAAGEYNLQIVKDQCKSNQKSVVVDVVNMGAFIIGSTSITNSTCQGTPLTLSTNGYSGFNYQWIQNASDMWGQVNNTLSVTQTADYKVRVSYPAIAGCTIESPSVSVKVLTPPTIAFSTTSSLCVTKDIVFTSAASVFDPNGTPVYAWDFDDGSNATIAGPTHAFATAQAYDVSLSGSYLGVTGCSANKVNTITINTPVAAAINPSAIDICPDSDVTLTVEGGTFSGVSWSTGQTTNPLIITESGTFTVTATDANGCQSTDTQIITSRPLPTVTVSANPNTPVVSGQEVFLTATGGDGYIWSPAESIDNPLSATPIATPISTTTYTVFISATGKCTVERTIEVLVEGSVNIPNVFSPNGDSKNDFWIIPDAASKAACTLMIFDKSGAKVLEQGVNDDPWDGTYKGKPVPPGTYYYLIKCPNDNRPITGNILVAR
jgi:gliding motility-associated-like protein